MLQSRLTQVLSRFPPVLVGYSGGVDSALVAVVARRVLGPGRTAAAIGRSASLASDQYEQARALVRKFDLTLFEAPTAELDDPDYTANRTDRCYFCKRELWNVLGRVAREHGFSVIADGRNADDASDHRPGARAGSEARIRSPLLEAGYGKAEVRREARALGIPIWDAPAAPCLSSRVVYGLEVTPARLRQVERGESLLRAAGVRGDLRVRHRGAEARIEVSPAELPLVRGRRVEIGAHMLALGFDRVTLDLQGYRRGSLLRLDHPALELLAERA